MKTSKHKTTGFPRIAAITMTSSGFTGRLLASLGLAFSLSTTEAKTAPARHAIGTIVLVHGAFADGSSWAPSSAGFRRVDIMLPPYRTR